MEIIASQKRSSSYFDSLSVGSRRQDGDRLRAFRGQQSQHFPPHRIAQRPQQIHHVHRWFRRCGRGCDLCSIHHNTTLTSTCRRNNPLFAAEFRPILPEIWSVLGI
jgi:hypothetical protein